MRITRLEQCILVVLLLSIMVLVVWSATWSPRVWLPDEVPVAFWAWRLESPSQEDVDEAVKQTGTKVLFLRAGQIDYEKEKLNCIRRAGGRIPGNIDVHLAYNATRSLLSDFQKLNDDNLAATVLVAFRQDISRANDDQAHIVGLQLDFDIPTRLLSKYALVLRGIRSGLPTEMKLSVTGLPTWMESPALTHVLSACDFWVPQCYGVEVPDKLNNRIPISSPEYVSRYISQARDLGSPFYAGLAAYGYAIHYSREGLLIGIRGDLDPTVVAQSNAFEVSDQTPFKIGTKEGSELQTGEWRRLYKARRDVILEGTAVRSGEVILIQRPTAEGLRACAAKVRERAGMRLLGICVFRMPATGDSNTLTLTEITSALKDAEPRFSMDARAYQLPVCALNRTSVCAVVELMNSGTAALRSDEDGMMVLIRLPVGYLESASISSSATVQPVSISGDQVVPCSAARANAVKLTIAWWPPGARLTARFEIEQPLDKLEIRYAGVLENGSHIEETEVLPMQRRVERYDKDTSQ